MLLAQVSPGSTYIVATAVHLVFPLGLMLFGPRTRLKSFESITESA